MSELCKILERKDFKVLHIVFYFVTVFIDSNMEHEKTIPSTRPRTKYTVTVGTVIADMGQFACREQDVGSLKARFKEFRMMFLEMIDDG